MKSLVLLLLVSIGGSSGFGFYGYCDIEKQCDSALPPAFKEAMRNFPPDEFQLKEFCPPLLTLSECYKEVIHDCTGQTVEELANSENETVAMVTSFLNNVMNLNADLCDEETQLSKNYAANIQCFKQLVRSGNGDCPQESRNMYSSYRAALPYVEDDEETLAQVMSEATCMTRAYEMACSMKKVQETCGETAKDTFLEVVRRLQVLKLGICSESDLVTLRGRFVEFMEEEQRDFFSAAFAFRRRRR